MERVIQWAFETFGWGPVLIGTGVVLGLLLHTMEGWV